MIRRPPRSTRTDTLFPTRRSSDLLIEMPVLPSDSIVATPSAGSLVAIDCSVPASTQKVIALFAPASSRSTVWSIMTTRSVPVSTICPGVDRTSTCVRIGIVTLVSTTALIDLSAPRSVFTFTWIMRSAFPAQHLAQHFGRGGKARHGRLAALWRQHGRRHRKGRKFQREQTGGAAFVDGPHLPAILDFCGPGRDSVVSGKCGLIRLIFGW